MGIRDAARQNKPKEKVAQAPGCRECEHKQWLVEHKDYGGKLLLLRCSYSEYARLRTAKSCENFKQE